jgi:predicted ATPase
MKNEVIEAHGLSKLVKEYVNLESERHAFFDRWLQDIHGYAALLQADTLASPVDFILQQWIGTR